MNKISIIVIVIIVVIVAGISIAQFNNEENNIKNNIDATTTSVTSGEDAPPGSTHNLTVPDAVASARTHLAQVLKIQERKIVILTAYEKEWSNACLGLAEEGEMCAEVITPGYEVTMQAEGKMYVYRTNADGSVMRVEKQFFVE
jgi:hypothetical protein